MKLTPLKVEMLLQLHWNPKFTLGHSPAFVEALEEFAAKALIRTISSGDYKLTERGTVFVKLILSTPLPQEVNGWSDPRTGEFIK